MNPKKINWIIVSLALFGIVFFFVYSWFAVSVISPQVENHAGHTIFSWPDAMANNYFVEKFIQEGSFVKEEPFNVVLEGLIHPRSTNVVNSDIVPSGFLGLLFIFGWLGKIFTSNILMFITPLLAVIGIWVFYLLIKEFLSQRTAIISAILLALLAPYWYYANLSMLSTVPFVVFLIIGFYFLIKQGALRLNKYKYLFSSLSGFFIGLAIATRYLEVIWIALIVLAIWLFYIKEVKWQQILFFILGGLIPLAGILFYNFQTYGEMFTVGYLQMENQTDGVLDRLPTEFEVATQKDWKAYLKLIFMPFGFHPKILALNLKSYMLEFLWPYCLMFGFGAVLWIINAFRNKVSKKEVVFAVSSFVGAFWLVIYYGSWVFVDQLVLKNNTIGSSYTRYWLPLIILFLPVIAYLLDHLLKLKVLPALKYILVIMIISWLGFYSFTLVYLTTGDGLFSQREVISTYYKQYKKVNSLVESNAIIINNRADKIFFPEKRVIQFDLNYDIFPVIKKIVNDVPFYYYTMMPEKDINYINNKKISEFGLKLVEPQIIDQQFKLFKLVEIGD